MSAGTNASTRLLVVGVSWPPETFILRRLRGLVQAGFEVIAATPDAIPSATQHGIRLVRSPLKSGWRLAAGLAGAVVRSPGDAFRFVAAAWRQGGGLPAKVRWLGRLVPLSGWRPDIVHFEWNLAAVANLPLFDLAGCPVVVSCRGAQLQVATYNPRREGETAQLPVTFEKAAAAHCVSQAILEEARTHGLDPRKAVIIRPAVDPEEFRPADRPARERQDSAFRIVTTGSIIWRKGYEYALMALRQLLDRGVEASFHLIGQGDKKDRERLLYTIDDLGLNSAVVLAGKQSPERVREILQESDVFLLSSLSEGISNAVLEAMACGLPVVTTDCGGMREAVTPGVEGFVVPVRSPQTMADALEMLARNAELRERMGRSARQRIEREFTLAAQIASWVKLYTSLTRKRPPEAEAKCWHESVC